MSKKKLAYIALFSFTSLLSLTAAVGAITAYAFEDKVLPRTYVAGIDISNRTFPEAQQLISDRAIAVSDTKILFTLEDKSANATLNDLGVKLDQQSVISQVSRPSSLFEWTKPTFWQKLLTKKELTFAYTANPVELKKNVEHILEIATVAQDAKIVYNGELLVVESAQHGISVSDQAITDAIDQLIARGESTQTTLQYTTSAPRVTTELATQTKTELESALSPIKLFYQSQYFTISTNAQYSLLDFTNVEATPTWQANDERIRAHLSSKIASKVNIKMLQKTIQTDTQQVTQEGRDGLEVDLTSLSRTINQTITEKIDTSAAPIEIPTRTIPFTEKLVNPDYVPGLFPGLYIDVNLTKQTLYIMNNTEKQAQYLISSGKRGTPTPVGLFYIKNKIALAQSRLFPGIWMEKWNALSRNADGTGYEGYGLHRVPCFDAACVNRENISHLGRPVSHGCVRISNEGADWVFDNAPIGTPVNIHL